jgi:hypothetical protein
MGSFTMADRAFGQKQPENKKASPKAGFSEIKYGG